MAGEFSERLQQAMAHGGMTGAELAERVDVTPGAVSQWTTGRKQPKRETAAAVAAALDVDVAWLEYGTGTGPALDLDAERAAYASVAGWRFRGMPEDRGMDFGNANIWVFDPDLGTFTREVLQNVLDVVRGASAQVFFRLIRLRGASLTRFLEAIKWSDLETHLEASAAGGQKFGRSVTRGLKEIADRGELLLLRVEEHGTNGLVGPEFGQGSNFAALCRNNLDSEKTGAGAGGAFGLGKAVLWRGSSISTVLFNSDLAVPEDGKQEGRLIGRSELSYHPVDDEPYAGPGWFGQATDGRAESYWGNRALAKDLCLERPPGVSGTSTLVVGFHDPTAEESVDDDALADGIAAATSRHFWPALEGGRLEVVVEVAEGPEEDDVVQRTRIDPAKSQPEFSDMLAKHESDDIADQLVQEGDVARRRVKLRIPADRAGQHGSIEHEALVLVRRAAEDEEDVVVEPNQAAVFRGTGMVVYYMNLNNIRVGARPFHAAVLCGRAAGGESDHLAAEEFLRLAEPPAHNRWELTPDLATSYERGSGAAIDAMNAEVREVIKELVGPTARDLSDGPRGLKELLKIKGQTEDPKRPRITSPKGEIDSEGRWAVEATVTVHPTPGAKWKGKPIVIFAAETGGGSRVQWAELEAVKNCSVEDSHLVLPAGKRQAVFRGVTDPSSYPVPAAEAAITVDFRSAEMVGEGAGS